jgi:hypothetical protein
VLTNAEFSRDSSGKELDNGKSLNGSKTSRENGSNTLLLLPPKKLGISDIFFPEVISWMNLNERFEDCYECCDLQFFDGLQEDD